MDNISHQNIQQQQQLSQPKFILCQNSKRETNYLKIPRKPSKLFSAFLILYLIALAAAKHPDNKNNRHNSNPDRECIGIGNIVRNKGFTYPWWEASSDSRRNSSDENASNPSGSGCPLGSAGAKGVKCCKSFDTTTLRNEIAKMFTEKWMGPKLSTAAEIFQERRKKFDTTFKDLLTRAHGSFHAMFERTYGMLYIQHAPIFHALFTTLETYYDSGRDSLEAKLNEFFVILTRKMFQVLNAQYDFDDAYLSCATIVVNEKQGGDLHRQIVSSLRRSFVATRALAQGLSEAERVLNNLKKIKLPQDCLHSLSQMVHCPVCAEQRAYKPCLPLCMSTTTKCLLSTARMNKPWADFTNALEGILDRLLGPYNVEAVVEPIHIKISEAIMNFQESGNDLSQAVFSKCGKPKLKSASATRSFRRREIHDHDGSELMQSDRHGGARGRTGSHSSALNDDLQPTKSLEKLLKEIKSKVKKSKSIWNVLPKQVCNSISKDYSSKLCWNGSAAIEPDKNKPGNERSEEGPLNLLVAEQVFILQLITDKLRASYNGLDVKWVQDVADELDFEGSGLGMGSGSGDVPFDLEEGDDDDPGGGIKQNENKRPQITPESTHNFNNFNKPKFPLRPTPPILSPVPGQGFGANQDDDGEDDEDGDDDGDEYIHKWDIGPNFNNLPMPGEGSDIDFAPRPAKPPKVSEDPPPPVISSTNPTTTTTTTIRPSRKPSETGVKKTTVNGSGAIAVFKLFSPIIVSMIGKVFSFS